MGNRLDLEAMRPDRVLDEAHIVTTPMSEGELEAMLKAMLSTTEAGYLLTDLEHKALACNERFAEFFGVEAKKVPSMGVEELRDHVYPRLGDPISWRSQLDLIYERPADRLRDLLILEGPFLVLRRTTGPVTNSAGEIIGRIWAFDDCTAEQHRLRRQEAIYEISTFNDPDPARVCAFVVDRLSEFYGSTALLSICEGERLLYRAAAGVPEWIGDVRENTLKDSYCQFALAQLKPLIIQDSREVPETCNVLPARIGFHRYLGAPITDVEGHAIGTICILDGRTDEPLGVEDLEFLTLLATRLSVELERQRLYMARSEHLATQLDATTSELDSTRKELVQAEKLSLIGTLAATIAHDIKNILSSLLLIAHQTDLSDPEKLERIKVQVDRFNVLSHRLLSYVKPRSVSSEALDLVAIIERAAEMLEPQARISRVEILLDLRPVHDMKGDPNRVEHMFVNLMLNALQAMRSQGGTLRISLKDRRCWIKDTGIGIPADVRPRIFEPFVSSRKDGFGLGLYSCQQIACEHGWTLCVGGEAEQGAVFEIDLGSELA